MTSKVFATAPQWTTEDFLTSKFSCEKMVETHLDNVTAQTATPCSIFWEEFMPDEILDLIVDQTNLCESQKPVRPETIGHQRPWTPVDREEIRAFLAISIVMGYHPTPELKYHWSKDPSLQNSLIKDTMSRDRFCHINSRLHFVENSQDRFKKIKPVLDILSCLFTRKFSPGTHITVDESLFKFKGKSIKQYTATKRDRFNFKVYRMCASVEGTGYTMAFKMYEGRKRRLIPDQQDVVMNLTTPLYGQGYTITIGHVFTCPELVQRLHNQKFNVVGTVMASRKYLPRDLGKTLKLKRGEISSKNSGHINYIVWEDNRTVRMLTTMHSASTELDNKKKIKPKVVMDYNKWKVDVNVSDQLSLTYESAKRTVKWYKKVFFYFFDMAMTNAFIAYKTLKGPMAGRGQSLTNFRIILGRETLLAYNSQRQRCIVAAQPWVPAVDRLVLGNHFLSSQQRRNCKVCWKKGKRQTTKFRCKTCNVSLCVDPCSEIYHTVENY